MVLNEGHGLPVGVHVASASAHEVTLIEPQLLVRVISSPAEASAL